MGSIGAPPSQEIPMNATGCYLGSTVIVGAGVGRSRWISRFGRTLSSVAADDFDLVEDDRDDVDPPAASEDDEGGHAIVATAGPILVVEDNDDVRDAMIALLETAGYATIAAVNGQHALELLHSADELPCLIVLDLMMPVMDGATFRRRQLDDPVIAHIPVVVVTAYGRSLGSELLGDAKLFGKPVDFERLIDAVGKHCLRR
jgi:two-component system, chemotaxis family, chemotaxis protein CheY